MRGAYVPAGREMSPRDRAIAQMVAVHERLRSPHWFSHESAALLWGLPTWRVPNVTHVRQRGHASAGRDRAIKRHCGEIDERHLTAVASLPVTDLEQTMVDCARVSSPLAGLVVADAALRAGADRGTALALLREAEGRNGASRARAVIELADGGAESPGETATRFVLLRDGLPRPQTQVLVVTHLGTFWADVGWDEWHVVFEYDGRTKYLSGDDLVREKRRQDAILDAGWRMVRVTKEDIAQSTRLAARARRLLPADIPTLRRPLLRA